MRKLKTKIVDKWRESDLLTEKANRHNNSLRFDRMADEAISTVMGDISSRTTDISWHIVVAIAVACITISGVLLFFVLTPRTL